MVKFLLGIIAAVFLYSSVSFAAPTYVYRQANGSIRFSDRPPPKGTEAKVFSGKDSRFSRYKMSGRKRTVYSYKRGKLYRNRYDEIIQAAAVQNALEPALIKAVIHAESAFNPSAVSPKGALGLMQLMPSNVRLFKVRNPFSPGDNIYGGSRLLAKLVRKYDGNLSFALAAYNAGEKAVERYGGIPPYRETTNYVQKVLSLRKRYQS